MTSSNETFRRSRVFTYLAGGLTVLGLGGIGVLVFQVHDLSERYGQIERDIRYYDGQREQLRSARDGLSAEISTLEARLQGAKDELRQVEQGRDAAVMAEKAASAARDTAQAKLDALLEGEKAAKATIANAEQERARLQSLTTQNRDLQRSVAELEAKKRELDTALSALRTDEGKRRDTIRGLEDQSAAASAKVEQLRLDTQRLERLKDQVAALEEQEADLGKRLRDAQAAVSKADDERQRAEDRLAALQAQVGQEEAKLGEAQQKRGTAEGLLASLQVQVDTLEGQKAERTRDTEAAKARLDQAERDRQTAEAARLQAETALATARTALQQVDAQRATAQADRDKAAAELSDIKAQIERDRAILAQIEAAKGAIATLIGQRDALDKEVQAKQQTLGALGVDLANATDALGKAKEALLGVQARQAAAESTEAAANARKTALDAEIQQAEARETALKDALTASQVALSKAEADRDVALAAKTTAEADLARLDQQIGGRRAVLAAVEAAEARQKDLAALIDELERTLNDRRDEVSKAGADIQAARRELKQVRDAIAEAVSQRDAPPAVPDSNGTPGAPPSATTAGR